MIVFLKLQFTADLPDDTDWRGFFDRENGWIWYKADRPGLKPPSYGAAVCATTENTGTGKTRDKFAESGKTVVNSWLSPPRKQAS